MNVTRPFGCCEEGVAIPSSYGREIDMRLSQRNQNRAAFHLGYNTGAQIPVGDTARFIEACNRIPNEDWMKRIVNHLDRCDRAWENSEVLKDVDATGQIAPSRTQRIFGDANRSIEISDPLSADNMYREIYLRECDRLAESLVVINYRRSQARSMALRSGSDFVNAIPGPADTSVSTRLAQSLGMPAA